MNKDPNQILTSLMKGEDIGEQNAFDLMQLLATGTIDPAVAGAILTSLRIKGESAEEVRGFANAMRELATTIDLEEDDTTIDIVGTGGDGSNSFNLSTGTALLTAATGAKVVKHGNRSVSSKSGSADLLEALNIKLADNPESVKEVLRQCGFVFLFAPFFHPAMKHIAPIRQALGIRTVFNILGPLTNPAEPKYYLLGAFSSSMAKLMAEALSGMNVKRAFVVHGVNGWDEPTPAAEFELFDVRPGQIEHMTRDPKDFGINRCGEDDLKGGDANQNAEALMRVFSKEDQGPHRDSLLLGTGLALEVSGVVSNLKEGIEQASTAIDEGKASDMVQSLSGLNE